MWFPCHQANHHHYCHPGWPYQTGGSRLWLTLPTRYNNYECPPSKRYKTGSFCHFWESSIKLKSLNPQIFLCDRYQDVLTGFVFDSPATWLRWPMRVRPSTLRILRRRSRSGLVGGFTLVPHPFTQTLSTRPTGRRLYRKGHPRKSRTSNHQVPYTRHRHPNTSQPQIDL